MTDASSELRLAPWPMAGAVAIVLVLLFVACWITAAMGMAVSHAWIGLFSLAPADSTRALVEGVIWSVVFGGLSGLIAAFVYNRLAKRRA